MSRYTITVNGSAFEVEFKSRTGSLLTFVVDGQEHQVEIAPTGASPASAKATKRAAADRQTSATDLKAPMPGIVSEVKVTPGAEVKAGDILVVIEAMKMENPLKATADAVVDSVLVQRGQEVKAAEILVTWRK
jgi:biotin carboxyl carrier protein